MNKFIKKVLQIPKGKLFDNNKLPVSVQRLIDCYRYKYGKDIFYFEYLRISINQILGNRKNPNRDQAQHSKQQL
jgi:hypothetical protein